MATSPTLDGALLVGVRLRMPRIGAWTADVAVDSRTAPTGAVTLALQGATLRGTVHRSGLWKGGAYAQLVGGAGGLATQLSARAYRDVPLRLPVSDVLREAGETLAPSSTGLDEQRPAWVRMAAQASTSLGLLLAPAGLSWRTLVDGTVWVGQETWPESTLEHEVLEEDHAHGRAVLWSQAFGPLPGETWRGRRLLCVQHEVEASRSRTTVWWSP